MKRIPKGPIGLVFLTCFFLFSLLTIFVNSNYALPGDEEISSLVSRVNVPFFTWLIESVSVLGEAVPAALIVITLVMVLLLLKRHIEALFVAVLPIVGWILNTALKVLIDRPRPGNDPLAGGLSYPSGHFTFIVIVFSFLILLTPKLIKSRGTAILVQVLSIIIILLVGVSRIYLEAHWLSDILGSLFLGGIILAPALALYQNYSNNKGNLEVARTT